MWRFKPIVRSWSAISRSLPQFAPARRPHARRRPMLECLEDPGLTHHNSEAGLAGKPCLLVKFKLLDHIFATFR